MKDAADVEFFFEMWQQRRAEQRWHEQRAARTVLIDATANVIVAQSRKEQKEQQNGSDAPPPPPLAVRFGAVDAEQLTWREHLDAHNKAVSMLQAEFDTYLRDKHEKREASERHCRQAFLKLLKSANVAPTDTCLLYTSPSPRDRG